MLSWCTCPESVTCASRSTFAVISVPHMSTLTYGTRIAETVRGLVVSTGAGCVASVSLKLHVYQLSNYSDLILRMYMYTLLHACTQ